TLWAVLKHCGNYPISDIGGASSLSSPRLWTSVILNFFTYSDFMIPHRNIMFKLGFQLERSRRCDLSLSLSSGLAGIGDRWTPALQGGDICAPIWTQIPLWKLVPQTVDTFQSDPQHSYFSTRSSPVLLHRDVDSRPRIGHLRIRLASSPEGLVRQVAYAKNKFIIGGLSDALDFSRTIMEIGSVETGTW
ncbi:hypothetical protein EV421DRAFT_1975373, partial [Armillaria borealis]